MGRLLHVLLLFCALILSTTGTNDIYSITLKDIEGNNVSMEDYKGKASDTSRGSHCRKDCRTIRDRDQDF